MPARLATQLAFLLAVALSACQSEAPKTRAASRAAAPADLVLRGGPVYTQAAVRSRARALAVRDGVLTYVGTERGVETFIGEHTRVVELGERTVLPSFQDVHIHPIYSGLQAAVLCDLSADETVEAYQTTIARCAEENPDASWINGGGWYMSAFPSGIPHRRTIDQVVSDRPVYLSSADGHSAWLNSRALAVAGITRETPDPPDGRIDRDSQTGEPVGALQEGAMELAEPPEATPAQLRTGLRYALEHLNALGITAFQDATESGAAGRGELEIYREFDTQGTLTARVVASLWWDRTRGTEQIDELIARRAEFTKGRLRATTIKIMQDGVMENHTAALLEPYLGKHGERGMSYVEPEALEIAVTRLDREGFQVHFHAIGDAAIRQSLDAVEAARKSNGFGGGRHHISHIQLFHPDDIPRFRQLGVVANFQPLWAFADEYITELTIPFLGPERSRWIYPIRSLLDSGAVVAFGSDWNVSSANPFEEIEVAVTRMGPDGETDSPFLAEERIDLASALAAFTINAAYVNGLEDRTGSIEVGKLADLIVVDRGPFEVAPSEISEIQVLLTLLEGEPVHGDWSLQGSASGATGGRGGL
jgi:predicted amidohydrolase YtcJ